MKDSIRQDQSEYNVLFVHSKIDDLGLNVYEFRIFCHLARRAGQGPTFPCLKGMAECCRMKRQTMQKALDGLIARGMVIKQTRDGLSSIYTLTAASKWLEIEPCKPKPEPEIEQPKPNKAEAEIEPVQPSQDEPQPPPATQATTTLPELFERILRIRQGRKPSTYKLKPQRDRAEIKAWAGIKKHVTKDEVALIEEFYLVCKSDKCDETWNRKNVPAALMNQWAEQCDIARAWKDRKAPARELKFELAEPIGWRDSLKAACGWMSKEQFLPYQHETDWSKLPRSVQEAIK